MAGNFTRARSFIYLPGAIILSNQNNTNENTIYEGHNSSMHEVTGHTHSGAIGDGPPINTAILPQIGFPGFIAPFYDFNGQLTVDTNYWAFCDGSVKTITRVNGTTFVDTLPDLSGRYLVGFGTDGGGNIATALWSAVPVGNPSHQINLQHLHTTVAHDHTVNAHSHSVDPHSHLVPDHYHGKGTLAIGASGAHTHLFYWLDASSGSGTLSAAGNNDVAAQQSQATSSTTHTHPNADFTGVVGSSGGSNGDAAFATSANGSTTSLTALTTNTSAPNTNNALSTTQSIQPRSVLVRWVMRIK